ncbi:MAG: amidase [Pseudomonadales bacterium]|nr:amidase [Pseudomonadales bacterium]
MLNLNQYLELDACAMSAGLQAAEFSAAELIGCAIEQAEKVEPKINSLSVKLADSAVESAQQVDSTQLDRARTPFAGVPFLIKDLAHLAGSKVTFGSRLYPDTMSQHNSVIVQRYLDAGLVVLGKSNSPEFGLTITTEPVATGNTNNPWQLNHSAGGSSGGAAAAVAAGIVPVAHATDAGGSIRIPASCCGLFGHKPSRGLTVSDNTVIANRSGLTVNHVVSRTVRDSAHFLEMARLQSPSLFPQPDIADSFADGYRVAPKSLRIAVQTAQPFGEAVDADCLAAVTEMAKLCEKLGHSVEEFNARPDYAAAAKAMNKILCTHTHQQVTSRLNELDINLADAEIESSTTQMTEYGSRISATDYVQALDTLHRVAGEMTQLHEEIDVVLSPVLASTPARLGWLDMNASDLKEYSEKFRGYSGFVAIHNGTGQPSMSVPSLMTKDGLPIGAMFSGAWGSDLTLLQLAHQIEQAQPWQLLAPLASA